MDFEDLFLIDGYYEDGFMSNHFVPLVAVCLHQKRIFHLLSILPRHGRRPTRTALSGSCAFEFGPRPSSSRKEHTNIQQHTLNLASLSTCWLPHVKPCSVRRSRPGSKNLTTRAAGVAPRCPTSTASLAAAAVSESGFSSSSAHSRDWSLRYAEMPVDSQYSIRLGTLSPSVAPSFWLARAGSSTK